MLLISKELLERNTSLFINNGYNIIVIIRITSTSTLSFKVNKIGKL